MPELAEVEYYRRQWDSGLGQRILRVRMREEKRVFRGTKPRELRRALPGCILLCSEARGKQMLFRFSKKLWIGLHLGMTGTLRVEKPRFQPGKHDHLVLYQIDRALVFSDMRQFGRVRFQRGSAIPGWWLNLPPALNSGAFTIAVQEAFLQRHAKLTIKAALLLQTGFPGVGNWMADEILWRAGISPRKRSGTIQGKLLATLWRRIRWVCRGAMRHVSPAFADPPKGWLYHERWVEGGRCPIDRAKLRREVIGGRTTAWCPKCQK